MDRQFYPQWYQRIDVAEPGFSGLTQSGCMLILKERDAFGRRVLLTRPQCFDFDRFSMNDVVRFGSTILDHMGNEEVTQVAGFVYIIDGSQTSGKFLSLMPLEELKIVFKSFQETCPLRLKHVFLINFSPVFVAIAEVLTKLLSEKLRKRITFIKSIDEMLKYIDPKILPKEYGGDISIPETIKNLSESLGARRMEILGYDETIVTKFQRLYSNNYGKNSDCAVLGSFRKLNID